MFGLVENLFRVTGSIALSLSPAGEVQPPNPNLQNNCSPPGQYSWTEWDKDTNPLELNPVTNAIILGEKRVVVFQTGDALDEQVRTVDEKPLQPNRSTSLRTGIIDRRASDREGNMMEKVFVIYNCGEENYYHFDSAAIQW